MFCPHCGRKNSIYALECRHCAKVMKTQAELDAELKRLWEGLPPEVQAKVKKDYQDDLKKYLLEMETIRRSATKDIALAAIVLGVLGISTGLFIIPDILLGGLAGHLVRKKGGGVFWGTFLFGSSYLLAFAIKILSGLAFMMPLIIVFWTGGFWLALVIGRYYGEHIDQKSTE